MLGAVAMLLPPALSAMAVTQRYQYTLNHCSHTFVLLCRSFNCLSPLPAQMLLARAHKTRAYASQSRFVLKQRIDDAVREEFISWLVSYVVTTPFAYAHALQRIIYHAKILDSILMHLLSLDWAIKHLQYNVYHVRFGSHLLIPLKNLYTVYEEYMNEVIASACTRTERSLPLLSKLNTSLDSLHDAYTSARQQIYYSQHIGTPFIQQHRKPTLVRMPSLNLSAAQQQLNQQMNNSSALPPNLLHDMLSYRQRSRDTSDSDSDQSVDEETDETLLLNRDAALRNNSYEYNFDADDIMTLNYFMFHVDELIKQSAQLNNEPPPSKHSIAYNVLLSITQYLMSFFTFEYIKTLFRYNHVRLIQSLKTATAIVIASTPIFANVQTADIYGFWAAVAVAFTTSADSASAYNAYVLRIRGTLLGAVVGYAATAIFSSYSDIYKRSALLLPWIFYTGYQRSLSGPFNGYNSMVGAFTAIVVSIGYDQTLVNEPPLALAVKRIEENLLGILVAGFVTCTIYPLRADNLLRSEIYKTLKLFVNVFETSLNSYLNNTKLNRAVSLSYNTADPHSNLTPIDRDKQMSILAPVIVGSIAQQLNYLPLSKIEPKIPPWSADFPIDLFRSFIESERIIQMFLISMDLSLQRMKELNSQFFMTDSNDNLTHIRDEVTNTIGTVSAALQNKSHVHQHSMYTLHIRILEFQAIVKAWSDTYISNMRAQMNANTPLHSLNSPINQQLIIPKSLNNNTTTSTHPITLVDNHHVMCVHNFLMSLEGLLQELITLCQTTRLIIQTEHPQNSEQPY